VPRRLKVRHHISRPPDDILDDGHVGRIARRVDLDQPHRGTCQVTQNVVQASDGLLPVGNALAVKFIAAPDEPLNRHQ